MSTGVINGALNYLVDHIPEVDGGIENTNNVSASSYKDITVTFSTSFSSIPKVVCCLQSSSTASAIGRLSVAPHDITKTGFVCRVFNSDTSQRNPNFSWIAIKV